MLEKWNRCFYKQACTRLCIKKNRSLTQPVLLILVGSDVIFSHQFLNDLDRIWTMREWIPNPTKPILPPNLKQIEVCPYYYHITTTFRAGSVPTLTK